MTRIFLTGLLLLASRAAVAAEPAPPQTGDRFYCADRKLGTWFYCVRPKPAKPEAVAPSTPPVSAVAQLDAVTAELRELKAKAILEPNPANVTAYIRYQRAQLDRASLFGDVWQRTVWQTPDLDYTLERPVGTVAKQTWLDARNASSFQSIASTFARPSLAASRNAI